MLFRIGINLGDVMVKDGNRLCGGVNVAASNSRRAISLAAVTPPPLTRFDGTWRGEYRCGVVRANPSFTAIRTLSVRNGIAVFEGGAPNTPGWHRSEGRIRDDGQVVLAGKGISSLPDSKGVV